MLNDPETTIKILTALKEERAQRQALEDRAEADRPKIVFAESIEVAKTSILVGEMAKLIKQSTGHDIGQNRFFDFLRENGYLHKSGSQRNMPTQRCIEAGWMEIKEGTRIGSSGECHITRTTKITGRGQIYFINLFATRKAA
ncbi:phage antirepressor KilAC domain-containing protein [Desulfovibrio falkowii]